MAKAERTRQRIIELEQDWKQLADRIKAVRRDLSQALESEREVVLVERLGDLDARRAGIEAELNKLEQELNAATARTAQRVFISYKHNTDQDEPLAMYLTRFLSDRGRQVFIDQRMTAGIEWAQEIHDQIARSDFFIVLISPTSMNSGMVLDEVQFADMQWRETGRPRIVPVRMAYERPLPGQLDAYLRPLQYILWTGEADTPIIAQRLLNAMEGTETLERYAEPPEDQVVAQHISSRRVGDEPVIEPYASMDASLILESPAGAVDLESPFYIRRREDNRLARELCRAGTTTTIQAARQMGKTSLLVRGIAHARRQGCRAIWLDFQTVDAASLRDLDTFLRYLAQSMAASLNIPPEHVQAAWTLPLTPQDRLARFVDEHVLDAAAPSTVLAIDEADHLFDTGFRRDFFSMIRSWDTRRQVNPAWKKLNVVMVISTQPFLLIDDVNQSPFNIGTQLRLDDFTPEQVRDLNERHGAPLNDHECEQMMALLGGHPYLVRQALYTLVDEELTWDKLDHIAAHPSGPFGTHLRQYLWLLRDKPHLVNAIKDIPRRKMCSDEIVLIRLIAAGLARQEQDGTCRLRCSLYERYFGETLR
ncbi:MAG: AAA-like domain-containing protein [Anaerolineae bacterium]|nr:AAA-like domain-containing protein [Anaerolineae bacterium]